MRRRWSPDAMARPRIKFIWGGAKQVPGHWRLGLWGAYQRQVGSPRAIAISVRGVLLWLAGLALAGYLAGATALYFWFARSPYNIVTWTDTLLLPVRWDHVRELRGRMMIEEGLTDLRNKRWGEAHMKLRVGLARAPRELRARLALAEFYVMANRRPQAIKVLNDGLETSDPGKTYLTTLFSLASQAEDFETIVAACDRYLTGEHAERAWLLTQKAGALISAGRAAEALALAEAEEGEAGAMLKEARVLALIELGRHDEAIDFLATWRGEAPHQRAQILRLQVRALREARRIEEMETALEELRQLTPVDPRVYVYGIVQRWLAGETEAASASLEDFFQRFASRPNQLQLASTALAEAKAVALVRRCTAAAAAHGFKTKMFLLTQAQSEIEAGEWKAAAETLTVLKPQMEGANAAETFFYEWIQRLAAVAMQSDQAPEGALVALLERGALPIRVYRQTAEALIRAERFRAAKSVLEIAQRGFPTSGTLAKLELQAEEGLRALEPKQAIVATAAAEETARAFFARLKGLEEGGQWREAAQAIRTTRVTKPSWLAGSDAEVLYAQMRVAIQTADTLELLGAAAVYLNGDRERAMRVVTLASELGEMGRKPEGERLLVEVLRKTADFAPALRLRKEWEPPAEGTEDAGNAEAGPAARQD